MRSNDLNLTILDGLPPAQFQMNANPHELMPLPKFRPTPKPIPLEEHRKHVASLQQSQNSLLPLPPSPPPKAVGELDQATQLRMLQALQVQIAQLTSSILSPTPALSLQTPPPPLSQPQVQEIATEESLQSDSFSEDEFQDEPTESLSPTSLSTILLPPEFVKVDPPPPKNYTEAEVQDWTAKTLIELKRVDCWKLFRKTLWRVGCFRDERWPADLLRTVETQFRRTLTDPAYVEPIVRMVLTIAEPSARTQQRFLNHVVQYSGWLAIGITAVSQAQR